MDTEADIVNEREERKNELRIKYQKLQDELAVYPLVLDDGTQISRMFDFASFYLPEDNAQFN